MSACGESAASGAGEVEAALFPTGAEFRANRALVEEATKTCMQGEGFEYIAKSVPIEAATYRSFPRLHTLTAEQAAESGFGFARVDEGVADPNASLQGSMTPIERDAWLGAYVECVPEAEAKVNAEYLSILRPLRDEYQGLIDAFEAEPQVMALDAQWAACMRLDGFGSAESFTQFAAGYLETFNGFVAGAPGRSRTDQELGVVRLIEAERVGASGAVACAEPIRDDYRQLWIAYQRAFAEGLDAPSIPQ